MGRDFLLCRSGFFMYVSRVSSGCGVGCAAGSLTVKLSGGCGCVHGTSGRCSGVALCCSFS